MGEESGGRLKVIGDEWGLEEGRGGRAWTWRIEAGLDWDEWLIVGVGGDTGYVFQAKTSDGAQQEANAREAGKRGGEAVPWRPGEIAFVNDKDT